MNDRETLRQALCEFLGPFTLVFAGVGAIIATQGGNLVAIAFAHGLAIGLMVFTIVSLIRRGASGWAWLFWGAIFSLIGYLLYSFLRSSMSSGGGGGGFSGGSFGGGYSGGGGATGSW